MKNNTSPLILIVSIILGGCYSYKPPPEAISGTTYTGLTEKAKQNLPETCKELTIEKAKEIALANNPSYLATRHSIAAATARFYQSLSAYLPTVSATFDWQENKYTPANQGGIGRNRGGNRTVRKGGAFTGRWMVFNGLMRTMDMLAAKHDEKQAEALNRDSRRLLVETIGIAYNNILLAKENIRIAKADEIFNTQLHEETKLKFEAGAVPLSDVLNFEIRVNTAKNTVIDEEFNFFTSRSILAELMGFTSGIIPEDIFPPLKPKEDQFSIEVGVYLDTALQTRPDLKAYRESLESAQYNVYSKWGAFAPTAYINTSWGYSRSDPGYSGRYKFSAHTKDRSFNYGFEAEWVLFNGGRRISELREAQAILAEEQETLTEKWLSVVAQVRQAFEDRVRRAKQIIIYKENLALVTKNRELVEESYKAGNTSITRLNEAQNDLVNADSDYASSIIALENSKVRLNASIGVTD
jgi:outer membrane protein